MTDRAHIRQVDGAWTLVKLYGGEKGFWIGADGSRTSPVVIGDERGPDKIVVARVDKTDTSTGTVGKVKTNTGYVVAANGLEVVQTINIRDKTQAEMEADADADAQRTLEQKTGKALFRLANEIQQLKGQQEFTPDQFKNWWKQL